MHWTYALLLVNPIGVRYRPAPEPGSPLLEEARALAAAGDLTHDDLAERYGEDPWSYVRLFQERELALRPDDVEAPAGWPAAIVELVVMALAARPRRRSRRLVIEERRSWRQAWRTSTARPVSSDSTAASDTAAAA